MSATTATTQTMPALTSTERSRLYRQRQKAELGEEAYKRQQSEARKRFRVQARAERDARPEVVELKAQDEKVRQIKQEVGVDISGLIGDIRNLLVSAKTQPTKTLNLPKVKEEIKQRIDKALVAVNASENCDTLNKHLQQRDGKASLKTIEDYQNQIRILHNKLYPNKTFDCSNYDFLKDVDKVIAFIRKTYKSKHSQSKKINSITSIIRRLAGFEDVYKQYSKLNVSTLKEVEAIVGSNELSETQQKDYLPWTEILKAEAKITDKRDKMLYSLYSKIPPRRLEYRTLLLTQGQPKTTEGNYLVMKQGIPEQIILNNYKTAHLYRQYVIDLSKHESLQKSIKAYIKSAGIYSGDYLFRKKADNEPVAQSYFTRMLQTILKKYTGKKIGVNLLRHSFITHTRKGKLTLNQKRDIARAMAHSTGMADQYEKIER